MIDAQSLPRAIQWHEGMLLAPQHFQQLSIRHEELMHYHFMTIAPFHWGVRQLKVDQVLLVDGTFRVLELEAVMPDGLVVYHLHPDEKNLEMDLSPYVEEMKQKELTIHLVVPATKSGTASVRGALARFDSVEGKPVADENTGESEISIPQLKPRINILLTETPPQKYSSFPIAKVTYKNETFTMTDYIAPVLAVYRKSAIWEMCSSVSQRLREKAVFLSDKIGSPSAAVRGPMILETKFLIQSMVSGLPHFEAVLNTGVSHPYMLYLSLCSLVGNLASLGLGQVPPVLDTYDHNDLCLTFEHAKEFIFRMIDEGVMESHTAIPFDFDNGLFSLKLETDWMAQSLVIGVRGRPGTTEKDMLAWMEESLIGSFSIIESMREKRILGASRKKVDGDDELLPARDVILFSVKVESEFILPEETLQIFNTSDPKGKRGPIEIMLYVKKNNI